ncbi:MAG: hypothetical protein A2X02_05980 [Bacteroidetes bacterium GWF2_29_10]|nr:MAG: hypothetical protein A2X02_05980 [Bacteroidetes bacterium GWF2_29_10]
MKKTLLLVFLFGLFLSLTSCAIFSNGKHPKNKTKSSRGIFNPSKSTYKQYGDRNKRFSKSIKKRKNSAHRLRARGSGSRGTMW